MSTTVSGRALGRMALATAQRQVRTATIAGSSSRHVALPAASTSRAISSTTPRRLQNEQGSEEYEEEGKDLPNSRIPVYHVPTLARKDPQLFNAVRPSPRSAFVALAHRLKLINRSTHAEKREERINLLVRACTHPSFASLVERAKEVGREADSEESDLDSMKGKGLVRNSNASEETEALDAQYFKVSGKAHNSSMAHLGNSLLGLITVEYLHLRYPNMPNRVIKSAMTAYVGTMTLSNVSAELGITARGIVRWDRLIPIKEQLARPGPIRSQHNGEVRSGDAFADALRAIVALIFQEQGMAAARQFVQIQLLSRTVDLDNLLRFEHARANLTLLMQKLGKEQPESRLIAESGRVTRDPIFVVGVWSGKEKLGEGTGTQIRMAEHRAATDALRRYYLRERPLLPTDLPTSTMDAVFVSEEKGDQTFVFKDVWNVDQPASSAVRTNGFQPKPIGESESVFGFKNT